jgi:hypothetical protein
MRFWRPDSTLITSSNGQISSYPSQVSDTTGLRRDWTYLSGTGQWYLEQTGSGDEVIDIYETGGTPDSLILGRIRIPSIQVCDSCVTYTSLQNSIIDSSKLQAGAVDSIHIASGAIDSIHIAAGAIDSIHIAAGAIKNTHLSMSTNKVANLNADAVDGYGLIVGKDTWTYDATYDTVLVTGVDTSDVCIAMVEDITATKYIQACDCRTDSIIVKLNSAFSASGVKYVYVIYTD